MLGAILTFIPILIVCLLVFSEDFLQGQPSERRSTVFLIVILAIIASLLYGALLFGSYAFAGGLAIQFRGFMPVALRIILCLIPVAFLYTLMLYISYRKLDIPMTLGDWLQNVLMVTGWGLGLWLNKKTESVLGGVEGVNSADV